MPDRVALVASFGLGLLCLATFWILAGIVDGSDQGFYNVVILLIAIALGGLIAIQQWRNTPLQHMAIGAGVLAATMFVGWVLLVMATSGPIDGG